jgi:hypothetical protein
VRPPVLFGGVIFLNPGAGAPPLAVGALLRPEAPAFDGGAQCDDAVLLGGQCGAWDQPVRPGYRRDDKTVKVVGHSTRN